MRTAHFSLAFCFPPRPRCLRPPLRRLDCDSPFALFATFAPSALLLLALVPPPLPRRPLPRPRLFLVEVFSSATSLATCLLLLTLDFPPWRLRRLPCRCLKDKLAMAEFLGLLFVPFVRLATDDAAVCLNVLLSRAEETPRPGTNSRPLMAASRNALLDTASKLSS